MKRLTVVLFSGLLAFPLAACGEETKVASPPPLPTMPAPAPAAPVAEVEPPTAVAVQKVPEPKPAKLSKREKAKLAKAEAADAKANKPALQSPAPAPTPVKPSAPAAGTPAKGKVVIPRTAHVNIAVPAGLQADLDKDARMQPWANQVISVIDKCHTQNPNAAGTIEVQITMHENARPDADIKKLPSELSPIVACATGGLMRTKMPLFTGTEGARYMVKINFSK